MKWSEVKSLTANKTANIIVVKATSLLLLHRLILKSVLQEIPTKMHLSKCRLYMQ